MTQLQQVRDTATPPTTAGRDGISRRARRISLASSLAIGAVGFVLLAAPSYAQTGTPKETTVAPSETIGAAIRPFRANVSEDALLISAVAWWRPDGPTRKPSPIGRRVRSWPSCRSWFGTGAAATTGGRRRRSSMPCRSS